MDDAVDPSVNAVTSEVVDAAIHVHRELGPGLLERAYRACLKKAIEDRGLVVREEVVVPATFEGEELDVHYRIDLLVEHRVPVELKACEEIRPVHRAQLLTYLRLGNFPLGLLVNFHVPKLLDGLTRLLNPDR